jgi:hypothetical protein
MGRFLVFIVAATAGVAAGFLGDHVHELQARH